MPPTDSDLKKRVEKLESYVKLVVLAATLLGLTGAWLFHKASDLTVQYSDLSTKYKALKQQADDLDKTLPTEADKVLLNELPKVFATEMGTLVHYRDHIGLKNNHTQHFFGGDIGGDGKLTTQFANQPFGRGEGQEEILQIVKEP
jgi:hypothetical protein